MKIRWAPPLITKEEKKSVSKVFDSNWFTQGPVTESVEKKICEITKSKYAVMTNNGTSALICSLLAHDIGPGDEVIVPSFTFVATVNAILSVGAKPILVDCDPETFNTEIKFIQDKVTKKTKAILPVDVSGMPVDINSFQDFANKNNLELIRDSAEGLGAEYNNFQIGSFNHTSIFSFHMAKIVSGVEGGCVITNKKQIAEKLKLIRSHGDAGQYDSKIFGLNFRISDIHSAIIFEQLKKLNSFLKHRQKIAKLYKNELTDFKFQKIPDFVTCHPYMLFAILVSPKKRNSLNNYLNTNGIETRICWPPVHKQKYHSKIFNDSFPNSEKIFSKIINLPMGNGLSEDNAMFVVESIKKWKNN
jgi:dTDP-4-amino-4,6-dideoxygalactose transaminase